MSTRRPQTLREHPSRAALPLALGALGALGALAWLAGSLASSGCRESREPDPPFERLAVRPLGSVEALQGPLVRLAGRAAPEAWTPRPRTVEGTREEGLPGLPGPAPVAVERGGLGFLRFETLPLHLECAPELEGPAQRVLLHARSDLGTARVTLALSTADGRRVQAAAQTLWPDTRGQRLSFEFPELARETEPPARVELIVSGAETAFELSSLECFTVRLRGWLPRVDWTADASVAGQLTEIDGDERRGFGLLSGETWVATLPPRREDATLTFAWAVPPELAPSEGRVVLRARIHAGGAGGTEREQSFELTAADSGRWQSASWPLGQTLENGGTLALALALDETSTSTSTHGDVPDVSRVCGAVVAELALRADESGSRSSRRARTVLLVTSDTHRADYVGGAENAAAVETPVLDELARQGLFFERAFSAANITNASHAAILSGRSPRDTGIFNNEVALPEEAQTLAEVFAAAGWSTWGLTSAQHLRAEHSGFGQGFDRFTAPSTPQRKAPETLAVLERWLADDPGGPLFVWLHLFDVHGPYDPPEPYRSRFAPLDPDPFDPALPLPAELERFVPSYLPGLRDLSYPERLYVGEVSFLDAQLGRVLAQPRFAEATVAVTGDHGENLGQHGIWFEHEGLYPDSVRVPLILSWPGGRALWPDAPANTLGRRIETNVSNVDLGRTLLDLAGLESEFPGRDLLDLAGGPDEPVYAIGSFRRNASITVGRWYLVLTIVPHQPASFEEPRLRHATELFDLDADPRCENDLVAEEPGRARALRRQLLEWLHAAPEAWTFASKLDAEMAAALSALGYVDAGGVEIEGTFAQAVPFDCDCVECLEFQ